VPWQECCKWTSDCVCSSIARRREDGGAVPGFESRARPPQDLQPLQRVWTRGLTDRSRAPSGRPIVSVPGRDADRSAEEGAPHWAPEDPREVRVVTEVTLPAISTVHAVLDRHGLVTRAARPATSPRTGLSKPRDRTISGVRTTGRVHAGRSALLHPLTITELCTRYLIGCDALATTRRSTPSPC